MDLEQLPENRDRVDTPDEYERDAVEPLQYHIDRTREMVSAVLAGDAPHCHAAFEGQIIKLDLGGLLDAMKVTDNYDLFARLLISYDDWEAKAEAFGISRQIVDKYCRETAVILTQEQEHAH